MYLESFAASVGSHLELCALRERRGLGPEEPSWNVGGDGVSEGGVVESKISRWWTRYGQNAWEKTVWYLGSLAV